MGETQEENKKDTRAKESQLGRGELLQMKEGRNPTMGETQVEDKKDAPAEK